MEQRLALSKPPRDAAVVEVLACFASSAPRKPIGGSCGGHRGLFDASTPRPYTGFAHPIS
jgi:hypothetical protein